MRDRARSRCPASTTDRTRWPPPPCAWRAGSTATPSPTGCATFAGVAHRLELIATVDGVSYVNDSKATNVASDARRAARLSRRRAPDRRRPGQAPGLLAARAARRRAVHGGLSDRRGGRRARAALADSRRAAAPGRRAGARRRRRPRRGRAPATSCCSRRRARATTSTPISRPAASISASSWTATWRPADGAGRGRCRRRPAIGRRPGGPPRPHPRTRASRPAAARAPDPDDGDALPAGVRGGDGLQRVLAARRAERAGERHRRVLPLPGVRRDRPGRNARARAPRPGVARPAARRLLLLGSFALLAAGAGARVSGSRSTARGGGSRRGRSSSSRRS